MRSAMAYKQVEIGTSDSVKIISMLYDGAINFIKIGKEKLKEGDIAAKGLYLGKASSIVGELTSSLNMEAGGEIARNLRRLYDFVLDRLLHGNMRNDVDALENAEKVLGILRDGWKQVELSSSLKMRSQSVRNTPKEIRA